MRGIWSSEELKFAKSKGYEITVIKGYQFNKAYDIFNGYINELFNLKKDSNGFLKLIYKSLLNKSKLLSIFNLDSFSRTFILSNPCCIQISLEIVGV